MANRRPNALDLLTMSPMLANRVSFRRAWFLFGFGSLLTGGISPLSGQEAGVAFAVNRSDHPVLSEPTGFELFASVPLFDWLYARISYDKISQDSRGDGEVCIRYAPNLSCWIETVHTESSMGSIRLSLLPTVHVKDVLHVGVGAGVTFSSLDASSLGESGRRANLEVPNTGQLGYQTLISMSLSPFPTVPLSVVGSATGFWVDFKACVTYNQVYDPFCGKAGFNEFSAGLAYHF